MENRPWRLPTCDSRKIPGRLLLLKPSVWSQPMMDSAIPKNRFMASIKQKKSRFLLSRGNLWEETRIVVLASTNVPLVIIYLFIWSSCLALSLPKRIYVVTVGQSWVGEGWKETSYHPSLREWFRPLSRGVPCACFKKYVIFINKMR